MIIINQNKELLRKMIKVELARKSFYHYCQLRMPKFYKSDRHHLYTLCQTLQDFLDPNQVDVDVLIINMPPRFGKSISLTNLCTWCLGRNPQEKIICASYNETLSNRFAKGVRNIIQEQKIDKDDIVYSDIFNTKIQRGDASSKIWSVEGAYASYLSCSPGSTVTGMGYTIGIIDDLIRNSEDSRSLTKLEKDWDFYRNTFLSRGERDNDEDSLKISKTIICFTRWNKKDLCGRLIEHFEASGKKYWHINMRAEQEDGTLLCPSLLDWDKIKEYKELMSEEIYQANYNQEPMDTKGQLYTRMNFYEYSEIFEVLEKDYDEEIHHNRYKFRLNSKGKKTYKIKFEKIIACVDWAGTGDDYCCCIIAGIFKKKIYILDILYTKLHEQQTAPLIEQMLREWEVHIAIFESNSGGNLFAQEIDRLRVENGNKITQIITFAQTKNKISRILSIKDFVMNNIFFMEDFSIKHREAFKSYIEYQAVGKNDHDDFEDCISLVAEKFIEMGYYPY